jgi:hypothetical protein
MFFVIAPGLIASVELSHLRRRLRREKYVLNTASSIIVNMERRFAGPDSN